jgi:hypothetical protein
MSRLQPAVFLIAMSGLSRWEDNIKMDLREMSWGAVDWIHLPQDRDQ